jgi:hypothetical protein
MSDITTGIIIGGIIIFVLQWAGKHFLDRLVLPKILDWWARQSKQMALNRAGYLLTEFELDFKLASNIQKLLLRIEKRSQAFLFFPLAMILLLILSIIAHLYFPDDDKATYKQMGALAVAVIIMYAQWILALYYQNKRDYRVLFDVHGHRDRLMSRLEKLFRAAGLDDAEIRDRIERIPTIPLSTP